MNTIQKFSLLCCCFCLLTACTKEEKNYDASGSFEAIERIISAEATGKIERLDIEEGQDLKVNQTIGQIDISMLELQSQKVEASIAAIQQKTASAQPQINILNAQRSTQQGQIASLEEQKKVLDKEVQRFTILVSLKAAPQKQLDDLLGQQAILAKQIAVAQTQIQVINQQIDAASDNTKSQNRGILSEVEPNKKQLDLLKKQMSDGTITNEYPGTVLVKYAYDGEFTSIGKPLYKIADLSIITLRVYVSGNQLPGIRIGEKVTVMTDDGKGDFRKDEGTIEWISNKAEFTPKTIQTKDERANLVYAVKIKVKNDGTYKIGMYGEIKFKDNV